MRARAYAVLIAVYVLAGRWGFERLWDAPYVDLDYLPLDAEPIAPYQLRFLIVGIFLLILLLERRRKSAAVKARAQSYAYAQVGFFAYCLLSIVWTPDVSFGVIKGCEVLIALISSIAIYQIVTGPLGPAVLRDFWRLMFWLTAALALVALGKAIQYGPERLSVLGGGPNVFGRMMGFLCLGGLYFWKKTARWWYVAAAVLAMLLIILSGSRGCLISVVAAVAAFFAVERISLAKLLGMFAGAAVLMTIIFSFTDVGRRAVETYQERVTHLLIQERYVSGRNELYQAAWQMAKDYPVLGGGLGSFRGLRYGVYPHNIFLEVLSEGGVAGVALLLLVLWRFERVYWQNKKPDGAATAAFVLILVNTQFSGDLYDSRSLFVFMMLAFLPKDLTDAGASA